MASHEELTKKTGVPVYFAERSSPWQRGANENFNGLARQYFPKGTNLAVHSVEHVSHVMRELNERPRKTLDYDTRQHDSKPNAPPRRPLCDSLKAPGNYPKITYLLRRPPETAEPSPGLFAGGVYGTP
jgi:hypothetical protein